MGVARKNLSADSLIKIVKYSLLREHFKSMKNTDYSWQDCIMSALSVFDEKGTQHEFNAYTDVPLNDANYDYRVNVLEYWETKKDGRKQYFSWVTKLALTPENIYQIMRAGRSRWKIGVSRLKTL